MGTDLTVVNAARVSHNKRSDWEFPHNRDNAGAHERRLSDKDQRLIRFLARKNHWTPFSQVQIQMRETVPIFVARQRFKHMVGFTYNEISRRYDKSPPEFYYPDKWRKAAEDVKQGSSDEEVTVITVPNHAGSYTTEPGFAYSAFVEYAKFLYEGMINSGVAPEQARMVLPQSMYTSYYVTGSLAAWARAYKQRGLHTTGPAQKEIEDVAKRWNEIISGMSELKHSWTALTQ